MKKIKLNNKLQLNKETIAKLNNDELKNVKGGEEQTLSITSRCTWTAYCQKTRTCNSFTCCW
jgi:natural product precursor